MNNDQNYFFYPQDLKQKTLFFGWTGPNLAVICVGLIVSVIIFFATFVWIPLLAMLIYMILTFTVDEQSAWKTLKQYFNYLFLDQLEYVWGEPQKHVNKE